MAQLLRASALRLCRAEHYGFEPQSYPTLFITDLHDAHSVSSQPKEAQGFVQYRTVYNLNSALGTSNGSAFVPGVWEVWNTHKGRGGEGSGGGKNFKIRPLEACF